MGSYRGRASFDAFVHRRSIAKTPGWMERLLQMRYPPYVGTTKYEMFSAMSKRKVNLDKEGNDKVPLWMLVLTSGGKDAREGLVRAAVVVLAALGIRKVVQGRKQV